MKPGTGFRPECSETQDRFSGLRVRQLTQHLGHSNHAYFTHPNWHDRGQRLLFISDRDGARNVFSLELETGGLVQVTDVGALALPEHAMLSPHNVAVNPARPEVYAWIGRVLYRFDLETYAAAPLFDTPSGFKPGRISVTADGKKAVFVVTEDLAGRFYQDLNHGYIGMKDVWKAKPHSRILALPLDGGVAVCVWEEPYWIGHVNTSPVHPGLLTFCHEGPWIEVDHRIWGMDLASGRPWKIRPLEKKGRIGHEYWLADGERVGYHGSWPAPEPAPGSPAGRADSLFGCIRHDNTEHVEFAFPHNTGHTHSLDFHRIVGDGSGVIRLWERRGETLVGPKIVCEHRSYHGWQRGHAHPVFHPDGRRILFTSNRSEYGNLYLVDLPESFDALPDAPLD